MGEHEVVVKSLPILRAWSDIDPKVIVGAVSSITVGGVVSVAAAVGLSIPTWAAALVVIAAYLAASYWTKTRIPVSATSGLTGNAQRAAEMAAASGSELSDGDHRAAIASALAAAGYILDEAGNIVSAPSSR